MVANPYKPTAGAAPPLLIGRQRMVDAFVEGLDDGPGAPGRLSLCTGPRGVGKTVMLSELGRSPSGSESESATGTCTERV